MIQALVAFSIRFRGAVVALACVIVGYGGFVTSRAKLDVFPEFAPPQVVIQTEAPGLSPEQVEALVTRPIENAVNGVGNLDAIRSQSIQGLSVVVAVFRDGTDVFRARQMVSERLIEAVGQMPQGLSPPTLAPFTSSTSTVLSIGLTSEKRSPLELRTFADWTVRPRLLGVSGVAKVVVFGGEVRQLQVQVKPEKLVAYDLGIEDVVVAARKSTGVRGAGFVETQAQRIVIRTEGQALEPGVLAQAVVAQRNGKSIRLADVARIVAAGEPKLGDAAVQGKPGLILVVSNQFGANTLEVTQAVERALEAMRPAFASEEVKLDATLFRPATFIDTAIGNVRSSLLLGGVLVSVVLFVFLLNFRTAFISLTAIPLSLLVAVIVLDRLGVTLNTLTLGGLAIAVGEVVDDAIIDVENIFRRLRENRLKGSPLSAFRVVLDASLEVRSAVVYATFVVVLVFVPVLSMSGIQGKLFAPLGLAYILAILASLAVALTVTPALSMLLLPQSHLEASEPRYVDWLKVRYRRLLESVSRRPRQVIGIALSLGVASAATLPFFGGAFLPELREGHFIVHMSAVPGTSLQESLRLGHEVTEELLKNPHIRSVSQQVGRAEQADDTWGTHYSEFEVDLLPLGGEEAEFVQSEIRDALVKFPGVCFAIKPFLTERIEETVSGSTAEVVVKVFGDDLDVIDRKADQITQILGSVEGAADVQVESPPGSPQVVVRLRPDRLVALGFQPVEVLESVQTAYQGLVVAQTYQGNRVYDVAVILDPLARRDPEAIGALLLRNADGTRVRLQELAEVYQTTGRYVVLHDGARRRQAVTCNVRGRDLASFVAEARRKVAAVDFPAGVYPEFSGTAEVQANARREILLHSAVVAAGIVLLLSVLFSKLRTLLLVLANLPFALIGGVLAVFFAGGWLSVGSLVGFVTLFGITTRNSIMMISHFEHLVQVEKLPWGPETALRGATERLTPVLMTALVAALGLLPIALGSGEPGREVEGPMAVVILGGLATSTVLNLLVLPTLALRYGRFEPDLEEAS
jgi:CzcA family heavy metal efflux pump